MRILATLLAVVMTVGSTAHAEAPRALTASDTVGDVDMPSWTVRWWQWAFSMDQRQSPVRDRTGAQCALNQSGPVWFLTGGFGVDQVIRYCTVPADRYLFFPLINLLQAPGDQEGVTCEQVQQAVTFRNTAIINVWLRVNSHNLRDSVVLLSSPDCFDLTARMPESTNAPSQYPAATSGLWVMLEPLPPGKHILQFGAQDTRDGRPNDGIVQAVEYVLTVEDK
ncbi:MAG: hypothetical protein AAGA41_01255 [Pseudomonadota bacterium]